MATAARRLLSGSTDGMPISVTGTSYAARVTIHTATAATGVAGETDEIYLWVNNTSTSAVTVTLQWGATDTDPFKVAKAFSIPASSPPVPLVTGLSLNNAAVVSAFAGTANVLNITGHVNRVTP
jgi:hypothetical protein